MSMLFLMLIAQDATGLAPTVTPPSGRAAGYETDAKACVNLNKVVDALQPELPKMVDAVTRTDGISVLCAARTYTTNKTLLVNASTMRDGWQGRKQAQFDQITCENEIFGPLARSGWRFVMNFTFLSGERFSFVAKC
jgi:hypothetical protein